MGRHLLKKSIAVVSFAFLLLFLFTEKAVAQISCTITGVSTACAGGADLTFNSTVTNGNSPTYSWTFTSNTSGASIVGSATNSTVTVNPGSSAGSFVIQLTVTDGTSSTCNQTVTVYSSTGQVLDPGTINPGGTYCQGHNPNIGGTSPPYLQASGGTPPYTYSWEISVGCTGTWTNIAGANGTSYDEPSQLFVSTCYRRKVTDACGNVAYAYSTFTIVPDPTVSITGDETFCQNATAMLSATVSNGAGSYDFRWESSPNGSNSWTTMFLDNNKLTSSYQPSTVTTGIKYYRVILLPNLAACGNSTSNTVSITVNPLPTATITGTTTVCQNAASPNITFTGANGTAPYTFTYTINNGSNQTITSLGNTATVAVPTGTPGNFIYSLISVQDASSTACSQLQTGSATVTVNPLPTATITGTTTVCQNAAPPSITFTGANGTAPYTFTYTINGGPNQIVTTPSGNSATVAVPTGTAGSFVYALVSVADVNSCSQSQSGSATVTINPTPVVTATPSSETICSGGTTSIALSSSVGGSIVSWTATLLSGTVSGFSDGSGTAIAQTLTNTSSAPAIVRYTISVIANGCSGSPITVDVTVNPLPAPTISGPVSACSGSTGNIYSTQGGMNNYVWSVSAGGTITSSTSTNSITVTWNVAGSQAVQVNYADANNCTAASPIVYNVTVNSIPTLTISDPPAVCSPSTVDLTASSVTTGSTGGLTFTYFTDATATSPLANPNAVAVSGTYYIKGTSASNCSIIKPVNVTVNASPTLTITNPAAVCSPSTVDLSLPAVTNNSGLSLSYWTNSGATTPLSNYTTAGAGTYYIKGTDVNGCYDIKPVTVTINATPTVTTSNTASVCTGSSTNIVLTATTASTFSWTIGTITGTVNGANAGSGSTISQVLTSSGNGGTVVYNVTPTSSLGCIGTAYPITVSVNTVPVVTTQPETINEVCAGTSANAVFIAEASGLPAPSVQWQVSTNGGTTWTNLTNGGNVAGATSTQLTLTNLTTGYDGYKYRAIFTNSCGSVTSTVSTLSISGTIKIKTTINQSSCSPGGYYTFSIELQGDQVASGRLEWWDGSSWQIVPGSVQTLGNGTPTYSYAILYSDYPAGTRFRINLTSNKCSLSYDSPDIPFNPTLTVTAPNSCIGGGNVTFTQAGGSGGTWSVTGGGTIDPVTGVFSPTTAGCWIAKYIASSGCEGSTSFVVFPASPSLTTPSNTCNAPLANITAIPAIAGFTAEYAVQAPGGTLSAYGDLSTANSLLNNTAGCWTIKARYKLAADCGGTLANSVSTVCPEATVNAVVFPAAPVLTAPINTCASSFTLPSVPSIPGFTAEYSIDGGSFTSTPAPITTPGCHTIKARYILSSACGTTAAGTSGGSSCESNTVNVVIFPAAPPAPVVSAGCGLFTVTAPPSVAGFDIQYSFDDGVTWGANLPPTADNCSGYKIKTRYVLSTACGSTPAGSFSSSASCKESPATTRIIDRSGPVITCNTSSNPSVCTNSANTYIHSGTGWDVSASDNCSLASVTAMLSGATSGGPYSTLNGITFNAGNTLVTWTATDACGNTSSCSFTVTVNSLPTITTAAAAASVCNSASAQTTPLTYSAVTNAPTTYSIIWNAAAISAGFVNVTDATLPASPITISVPAGAPVGTYSGTLTVKNANGCVSSAYPISITINPKPGPIIITHN